MTIGHHHKPEHHPHRRAGERSRAQRGYVLVMFALLLVPMLLLTGMAVDVGSWYNRTSEMRKAADAAALAGVVWLPDEAKARQVALETAAKNGFVPNSHVSITVTPSTQKENRLKVTIRDDRVGSYFYEALGGGTIDLTRTSFAEYILRVPLGSPRNYFGLGSDAIINTGFTPEFLYNSVNPYCTDKVNGDRYQSGYVGGTCSGTPNSEFYKSNGQRMPYEFYIDAVPGRPSDIEVRLLDPRYNEDAVPNGTVISTTCTYPYANPPVWNQVTAGWGGYRLVGPAQYQTWNSRDRRWNNTQTLNADQEQTFSRNSTFRFQLPNGPEVCTPTYGTEPAIDDERQGGHEDYTFTLYAADATPLNDNDNPVMCTKTFSFDTAFEFSYLGSVRWNKMPCNIPAGGTDGRYILRVLNSGQSSGNPENDGSNQWGLVARYTNASGTGLCDGRTDNLCPRVYGKDAISVKADAETSVASFFLAEIEPQHAGKTLRITLFDPGEGGNYMEIMMPSGTNGNTWTPRSFSWTAPGYTGQTSTTRLDVTGSKFNGKLVTIDVKLDNYTPPSNNYWWQIRYTFSGSGMEVTDRTTWGAEVIGDPIHLVEEYDY